MAIMTSTIGLNEHACNTLTAEMIYTAEHVQPSIHLITRMKFAKGERVKQIPKVGQATISALTEGEDLVDSQALGLTYVEAIASEVGAKFIFTDVLAHNLDTDCMRICGRMLGDGMGRKREVDIVALYAGCTTTVGGAGKFLSSANIMGVISKARASKLRNPLAMVIHPNTYGYVINSALAFGATNYTGISAGSAPILKDWGGLTIDGVPMYHSGDISIISGDDAWGCIFNKGAFAIVEAWSPRVEQERDASLRATELVITSDYVVLEIDSAKSLGMLYDAQEVSHSA